MTNRLLETTKDDRHTRDEAFSTCNTAVVLGPELLLALFRGMQQTPEPATLQTSRTSHFQLHTYSPQPCHPGNLVPQPAVLHVCRATIKCGRGCFRHCM